MVANRQTQRMTASEYLEWELQQEIRYEFCDGALVAMSGGKKRHDKLAFNLRKALDSRVEAAGCEMTGSDVKVMVKEGMFYRYPDLAVSCDERDKDNETFYQFPKLIVEVLSDSTELVDRGEKFQEYRQIPMLEEYVLVSTKQRQVECFRRGEGRLWLYCVYQASEVVEIASVGVRFPMAQLYKNIQLS